VIVIVLPIAIAGALATYHIPQKGEIDPAFAEAALVHVLLALSVMLVGSCPVPPREQGIRTIVSPAATAAVVVMVIEPALVPLLAVPISVIVEVTG